MDIRSCFLFSIRIRCMSFSLHLPIPLKRLWPTQDYRRGDNCLKCNAVEPNQESYSGEVSFLTYINVSAYDANILRLFCPFGAFGAQLCNPKPTNNSYVFFNPISLTFSSITYACIRTNTRTYIRIYILEAFLASFDVVIPISDHS